MLQAKRTKNFSIQGQSLCNVNFSNLGSQAKCRNTFKYFLKSLAAIGKDAGEKERNAIKCQRKIYEN